MLAYLDFGSNLEKILIPNKSLAPLNFLNTEKDARSLIKKKNARSVPKPISRLLDQWPKPKPVLTYGLRWASIFKNDPF